MSSMKMNLGLRDDEDPPLPFEGVDKSTVIQESKVFNSSTLDTRKCKLILIKMLYLLAQGETLLQSEATDLFFNTTKLLQSNDATLRRLVYIMVKELSGVAEHVFVASNTLCKDMNSDNDMYKANSIRALRKITDTSMLGPMERYLKQAVVDRADNVSSAAIVTGLHLSSSLPELVKRWSGEVGEALKQRGVMVQYHAVALLHKLRKSDKLSVSKLVQSVNSTPIRSPLALCLLIRMCRDILQEDYDNSPDLVQFVASSIKHSSEMVVFEAAKCICSLKNISSKELTSAIMVLQLYLTSHKPVLRFAAVRLLNRVATTHPLAVTTCNVDVESLITDSNRNIATLAITTLLKTGSEFSIDRLMKQINTFMSDIADEFKIVVIDAMRVLCVKFPHKYTALLGFLSEALREEGGFDFKRSIVDAIIGVIETNPSAKEDGLLHLCEFIEDCEFTLLSQRVLHLLGQLGPTTSNPHKYIRYIYNRVMLETPAVRAASVSALAKFAAYCPPLRQSVRVLLQRVVQDNDDEVRDRAVFYSKVLEGSEEDIQRFIVDVANAALTVKRKQAPATIELPRVELEGQAGGDATNSDGTGGGVGGGVGGAQLESAHERAQRVAVERAVREMTENPRLRAYGQPHFTTAPEHLTDTDTEYVVTYLKHSYPDRVVLQFRVHCNLDDVVLDNVSVKMDVSRVEGVEEEFSLPAARIRSGETTSCYVVLQRDPTMYPTGSIANVLSFAMKEVDKETGEPESVGTEDEYQLEEVVLNVCDYMQPLHVVNFHKDWEEVGELEQLAETYSLASMKTLQAAADAVVGFLGMEPHGNCRQVPAKAKSHQLLLAGVLCTDPPSKLLVKAKVFFSQENSVALDFAIRGADDETRNFLVQELMS